MARKSLRVGLVGVGAAAQISHIPALLKSEGVELVALCDRDPEKAARVAQKFSIPHHVSRIDGTVKGSIHCNQLLTIGEKGSIYASIEGGTVVIGGEVQGDIKATRKITLESTARVTGDLTTPGIVIQEGAPAPIPHRPLDQVGPVPARHDDGVSGPPSVTGPRQAGGSVARPSPG